MQQEVQIQIPIHTPCNTVTPTKVKAKDHKNKDKVSSISKTMSSPITTSLVIKNIKKCSNSESLFVKALNEIIIKLYDDEENEANSPASSKAPLSLKEEINHKTHLHNLGVFNH